MNQIKRVYLYGVHSVNLGDDLFFKILFERYPNTRFIMTANDIYKKMFKHHNNVIVLSNSSSIMKLIKGMSSLLHLPLPALTYTYIFLRYRIDLFLVVGGSLFMEENSSMNSHIMGLHKIRSMLFPKLKIAIIGVNFGPYKTKKFKKDTEKALSHVDDVCFRDLSSYNQFSHLPNIRWGNDIVMHIDKIKKTNKDKVVCVNIRSVDKWPTLKPYKDQYINKTKQLINHFQKKEYTVKLISFCESYGDNQITDFLYNELTDKSHVDVYYYTGNLQEATNIISSAEFMIATRFHAIILSLVYKVKVLPISYSIKTENMLKTYGQWDTVYGFPDYCATDKDVLLDMFIEDFQIEKNRNTQFEYLDTILN